MKFKFRVYSNEKDDDGNVGYLEEGSSNYFVFDGGLRSISYFMNHPDIFVVEQYTGIDDINGVPVFCGDFVRYTYKMNDCGDLLELTGIVDCDTYAFGIKGDDWFFNLMNLPGFTIEVKNSHKKADHLPAAMPDLIAPNFNKTHANKS